MSEKKIKAVSADGEGNSNNENENENENAGNNTSKNQLNDDSGGLDKSTLDESSTFTTAESFALSDVISPRIRTDTKSKPKKSASTETESDMESPFSILPDLSTGKGFIYMVLPPDGGYGWVIVFVSFLNQAIIDGIVFSIGITLPFIADDLQVHVSQIIFVSAVQISCFLLSGPISSAFINKYGFRIVAITGASGTICCLILASFSSNLETLIIFYSCLGGVMLSTVWVSSQLIVSYYFDKYRPIAAGISCSGGGIGFFAFAKLNSVLVPKIGWQHNARIHAGCMIVPLLLSIAFMEVEPSMVGIIRKVKDVGSSNTSEDEHVLTEFKYGSIVVSETDGGIVPTVPINELPFIKRPRKCKCFKCCNPSESKLKEISKEEEVDGIKRYIIQKDLFDKKDLFYDGPAEYTEQEKINKTEISSRMRVELVGEERTVASIQLSISAIALPRTDIRKRKSTQRKCYLCAKPMKRIPVKLMAALRLLFNFKLFRIMEFQILFLSAFIYALGLNIPFLFSKARSTLSPDKTTIIPMVIGISNCISRIGSGFIAFTIQPQVINLCGGALTFGGLVVLISAFYGSDIFWFQIMYAISFGMAPGFFAALRAVIYVKYLGLQNLTSAFGLIAMGMGIGIFIGTVLSGLCNDFSGGYNISFVFSGICILTAGLLMISLPIITGRRKKSKNSKFKFYV